MAQELRMIFLAQACLAVSLGWVNCELTRGPSDVYGVTGSTVTLHCSTNLSVPVQWEFRRTNHLPDEPWQLVYFGYPSSQITARYREKNKYNVTVDSTGNEYNLLIYNLQTDDAGTYRCIDDYGFGGHKHDEGIPGHEYRAQVATIHGFNCSESINGYFVDQRSLRLEQNDTVQFGCNVTCVGGIHACPNLLWSVFHMEYDNGNKPFLSHPVVTESEKKSGSINIMKSEVEIYASEMTKDLYVRCNVGGLANRKISLHDISNTSLHQLQVTWSILVTDVNIKIIVPLVTPEQSGDIYSSMPIIIFIVHVILIFFFGTLLGILACTFFILRKARLKINYRNVIKLLGEDAPWRVENENSESSEMIALVTPPENALARHFLQGDPSQQVIKHDIHSYSVTGLAVVDDQIFVVRRVQPLVNVYDLRTLTPQPNVNIPEMKSPKSMAGSCHNKVLYISDRELACIHRVNLNDKSVKNWKINYPNQQGISITLVNNVLVTICDKLSRVLEYQSEGQLIRDIQLDTSISLAWKTVQLSANQFIICHGDHTSLQGLSIINSAGKTIKRYGGKRGAGKDQLNMPWSLAIDDSGEVIFVADCCNHRILMFNKDLIFLGKVKARDDLSGPWTVHYDSTSARLFVGEYNGRVLIIRASEK